MRSESEMIETMKLALETLEMLARYENPETRVQVKKPRDGGPIVTMYPHKVATDAANALRTAIDQAEKQEPVAWQWLDTGNFRKKLPKNAERGAWNPLYTHLPRREWVGLTDDDIEDCWDGYLSDYQLEMIRAIEAELKEKNT